MNAKKKMEKHYRQVMKMYRLTRNELVNTYWQHIEEITGNGFVPFILRGAVCWDSPDRRQIESKMGNVWLKSDCYDPIGKPISEEPVKTYLQWYLNLYQIWGGIKTEINSQKEEISKVALEKSIEDIHLICNLLSLTLGVSVSWYPASFNKVKVEHKQFHSQETHPSYTEWRCIPLQRRQEEQLTTQVGDNYFENTLLPLFEYVRSVQNQELQALWRRAIAWHATGNFFGSGLNRFLHYWESVELLVHYFYPRLSNKIISRPSKSEKKDQVMVLAQQMNRRNCLKIANECSKIVQSSIKTQMQEVLPILTGRSDIVDNLFNNDPETSKSLYQLRNDIAHGNYCDHNLEFMELVDKRIQKMRSISKEIQYLTLQRMEILAQHIGNEI